MGLRGAIRATFVRLPYPRGASPRAPARCRGPSRGLASSFWFYSPLRIPFAGMRGGESYHAFLDGLAMALGELQVGNPSEALDPLVGSKRGVRWGLSSYSQAPTHIVVDPVRPGPTARCLSPR
jgi:hypothetical protein